MIRDFIAIDFETANQQPSSVCSVGVVTSLSLTIITIGVSGYMASRKVIQRMRRCFPKYGISWRNELLRYYFQIKILMM